MKDGLANHAVRGAAKILVGSIIGAVASLLAGIFIPRLLGPDLFGRFAYLLSVYNLAVIAASLGAGLLVTREFAPLYRQGQRQAAMGLYRAIFSVRFIAGSLMGLGVAAFLALYHPFDSGYAWGISVMMGAMILACTISETLFILQLGALRFARWGLFRPWRQWTRLILILLGFWLDRLRGAVAGILLAECLTALLGWKLARGVGSLWGARPDFARLFALKGLMMRSCATQLLIGGGNFLGPIMVAFFTADSVETGFYGLSAGLTALVLNVAVQGTTSFSPIFAIILEQDDRPRLARWAGLAARSGALGFIVMWGVFCLVGEQLIVWTVGEKFQPAYLLLALLFAATPFRWIDAVLLQLCNVHKRPELCSWSRLVQLAVFVGLGAALLLREGPLGLAFAFTAASALSASVTFAIVWRWLDVQVAPARLALSLLCAAPYAIAIWWLVKNSLNFGGRFLVALIATALALLLAHFSTALRFGELGALLSTLRGKGAAKRKEINIEN